MATQPTQLPVASESPRDLKFNAGKIDEFVTSLVNTYADRFGHEHYTIEGLRWLAQQAIAQYGWILIDSFQDGADITLPNQALRDEDTLEYYRWDGSLPKHVDAGSTPASSGGVGTGAWVSIGDASLRAMLASSADGKGDSLIAVKAPLVGAAARNQHEKNSDVVSVKDFGSIGDGSNHSLSERYSTLAAAQSDYPFATSLSDSIDWAALQAAASSGARGVYIPERTKLYITSKVSLPANDFDLYGEGPTSVITGSAAILIEYTPSALSVPDVLHYFVNIRNIRFISDVNDAVFIYAHSVWNGGGHPPHVVKDCSFIFRGLRQTGILCTGITAIRIDSNTLYQGLVSAKDNNTGYGVRVALGDDMSTSVMNIQMINNSITSISFPVYIPPRTLATGGRCEGVRLVGNMIGDGQTGVYIDSTIAVSITGNQISDYLRGIYLAGCQVTNISGNSEITGHIEAIALSNGSTSYYTDNVTIEGNCLAALKPDCHLIDLINLGNMNTISITGNTFKGYSDGVAPANTAYGISLQGDKPIPNSVASGNAFYNVTYCVHFGSAIAAGNFNFRLHGNTYLLPSGGAAVSFPERMHPPQYYTHTATSTFASTAGQTTLALDVSSAGFKAVPVYAEASVSTAPGLRLVYLHDTSTTTILQFSIQGTITAGTNRWVLSATGESDYGY